MEVYAVAAENQAAHPSENSGEIQPARKIGVEVVRSVELASRFFRGPRPGNFSVWDFPALDENEDWERRVARAGAAG